MKYRKRKDIITYLDVSIVLFFKNEISELKRIFINNSEYFQRNGLEVIIVFDNSDELLGLLDLTKKFPFINFKIIQGKEDPLKNKCSIALNAGIQAASFGHILILDPEVELIADIIYHLRYITFCYPNTFAVSTSNRVIEGLNANNIMAYIGIMFPKKDANAIRGFDENLLGSNMATEQFIWRLSMLGLKKMEVVDTLVKFTKKVNRIFDLDSISNSLKNVKDLVYEKKLLVNGSNWGNGFNQVVWDWNTDKNFLQLVEFLNSFNNYTVLNNSICEEQYEIIALIQVRNDSKNVTGLLSHLESYCDGFILLDDGSTDDSYEIAKSDKLLLKIQKNYKGYFDDLENRNDLLRFANFFNSKWFLFMDVDERFDSRYDNIRSYARDGKANVYRFNLVDLWNNSDTYRVDIPDRRNNGIINRARMFRNKGSMQIYADRELHFSPVPYSLQMQTAEILLLHYGNYDVQIREKKYKLYSSQDADGKKNGFSYNFLKDTRVVLKPLEKLTLESKDI